MKIPRDSTALCQLSVLFNEGVTGAVTDGQLLERFATCRGEASEYAFAALVEGHRRELELHCYRVLGSAQDAEDAVQEAMIAAFTQWPQAGIPDNPRGWLIQVASRRMADQARSEMARRERETIVAREAETPGSLPGGPTRCAARLPLRSRLPAPAAFSAATRCLASWPFSPR